ncbi:hypothetical protein GBA63_13905 [Rubrobacter tropicus]|uniref:Uncharacterized protein n=1 Tax=Rubrobacter tropicus TaxID=2653851 RepID=A0A6G8QAW9_9ACTN|nr:hypothetical protein [Rubrobacter tropicus]QIN83609.1 hypothetical protein GBA63_13905 [Rubrobacter tropicus]
MGNANNGEVCPLPDALSLFALRLTGLDAARDHKDPQEPPFLDHLPLAHYAAARDPAELDGVDRDLAAKTRIPIPPWPGAFAGCE